MIGFSRDDSVVSKKIQADRKANLIVQTRVEAKGNYLNSVKLVLVSQ